MLWDSGFFLRELSNEFVPLLAAHLTPIPEHKREKVGLAFQNTQDNDSDGALYSFRRFFVFDAHAGVVQDCWSSTYKEDGDNDR